MPLFFLLSGLTVKTSLRRGRTAFVSSRLGAILLPYLIWSIVQGGLQIASGGATNAHTHSFDLVAIAWQPLGQFWFLYALAIYHVLLALSWPRATVPLALALFLVSTFLPGELLVPKIARDFLFYAAGASLGPQRMRRSDIEGIGAWLLFAAFAFWGYPRGLPTGAPVLLPMAIAGIVGTCWVAARLPAQIGRPLAYLGSISLAIFVLHTIVGGATRLVMKKLGIPFDMTPYLAGGMEAAILVPAAAYQVAHRLGIDGYVGLAALPRRRQPQAEPAAIA